MIKITKEIVFRLIYAVAMGLLIGNVISFAIFAIFAITLKGG